MRDKIKLLATILLVVIPLILFLFFMIYQPGAGMYVRADNVTSAPNIYLEFSPTDLERYPYVREAVMNPGKEIKLPFDHTESMSEFAKILWDNKTEYIKVDGVYYKINIYSAD